MGKYKMLGRSVSHNDVIGLLSKLKLKTPDYPSDLLSARKAAFLQQAVTIKFDGPSQGGKGGGDGGSSSLSGGSGGTGALGGMTTAQGILLQAVIGVWIIAAMLTTAYVFRNQIIDLLQEYGIVPVEMIQLPSIDSPASTLESPVIEIPSSETPSTEVTSTSGTPVPEAMSEGKTTPEVSSDNPDTPDTSGDTKDNPGLHLGQTPGAPDTPNQDKPDKPNKPDKNK